ncbi:hypothetical protein ACFU6S_02675 [Streptomyces sp. NPDC057456]|uniref:hypothetical protein n=1 Tax=Streptomyces sp. NPDC057456 TaxID=3346139 RepID=UPI0036C3C3B3
MPAHCPELDVVAGHVPSFGQMLTHLQEERLPEWIAAVRADVLLSLRPDLVVGGKCDDPQPATRGEIRAPGTSTPSGAMIILVPSLPAMEREDEKT